MVTVIVGSAVYVVGFCGWVIACNIAANRETRKWREKMCGPRARWSK